MVWEKLKYKPWGVASALLIPIPCRINGRKAVLKSGWHLLS